MQKENPALTANGREPRLPVGGTLDWKETSFLTASHQRPRVARSGNQGIEMGEALVTVFSTVPPAQMKRDLTQIIVG